MKMVASLVYVSLLVVCYLSFTASQVFPCPPYNGGLDELGFQSPPGWVAEEYPPTDIPVKRGQKVRLDCCATGYQHINWYIDDQVVSQDSQHRFRNFNQGFDWLSVSTPGDKAIVRCELVSGDNSTLSHQFTIHIYADECNESPPAFTITPNASICASPGDNITVYCEVYLDPSLRCYHPFFTKLHMVMEDGSHEGQNVEDKREKEFQNIRGESIDTADTLHKAVTFYNISEYQLRQTYHCLIKRFEWTKKTWNFTTPCPVRTEEIRRTKSYFDKTLATHLSIPLVVVVLCACLVVTLSYVYRNEIKILWNTCLKPASKVNHQFDAYIIVSQDSKDQTFLVDKVLDPLEEYNYQICLPDRDFKIGAVIPQKMCEHVMTSRRVIVVLSPSVLQTDYCDLSLTTAIADSVPLIFIRPPHTLESEKEELKTFIEANLELSAAIRTSTVIDYPNKKTHIADFYNKLFAAMPLVLKRRRLSELTDPDSIKISEEKEVPR